MNKNEIINALYRVIKDSDLEKPAFLALSLIRSSKRLSIVCNGKKAPVNRKSILATYQLRQRRLAKEGIRIEGFDETVLSLSKRDCVHIYLAIAYTDDKSITMWFESDDDSVVGCFIGKDDSAFAKLESS